MSDNTRPTPETDAQTFDVCVICGDAELARVAYPDGYGDYVEVDTARKLERERDQFKHALEDICGEVCQPADCEMTGCAGTAVQIAESALKGYSDATRGLVLRESLAAANARADKAEAKLATTKVRADAERERAEKWKTLAGRAASQLQSGQSGRSVCSDIERNEVLEEKYR